jgi:hypothetical protein
MAVTDSRGVVIEATPDEIMDVLFDLESLPEWSSAHQRGKSWSATTKADRAYPDRL